MRGGFVAVLGAGQDDAVGLRVLVGSAGALASGAEISLEDLLNTANQVGIGQGITLRCRGKRNMDAVQRLVGVLTRVESGGERVAGQQLRLGSGEGTARLTQGGQQKLGQERVQ